MSHRTHCKIKLLNSL